MYRMLWCVIIRMNEVHVKSEYTYKGANVIWASMQPDYPAKTVFATMVQVSTRNGPILFDSFLVPTHQ